MRGWGLLPAKSESDGPALSRSWNEVVRLWGRVSDAEVSEAAVANVREFVGDGRRKRRDEGWRGGACRQRNLLAVPAIVRVERQNEAPDRSNVESFSWSSTEYGTDAKAG